MKTTETANSAIGPVSGKSYYQIQLEQGLLDGSIQRRKPGAEVPVLPPGQQPFNPAGVWNSVDRGPPPPVEEDG